MIRTLLARHSDGILDFETATKFNNALESFYLVVEFLAVDNESIRHRCISASVYVLNRLLAFGKMFWQPRECVFVLMRMSGT